MTIVQETPDCLILRKTPIVPAAILGVMLASTVVVLVIKTVEALAGRGTEDLASLGLVWLGLFAGGGVAALFLSLITVTFDRPAGRVTVLRTRLAGRSERTCNLADVTAAEIDSHRDADGDDMYRLALILHNGDRLPLTHAYENWVDDKRPALAAIQRFLAAGLPRAV